jgi:GT2 family glycosyltransferase
MKLSVIVVSYNTCDLTRACLQSVFTHPLSEPFEVFLVDNASQDGSEAMVRETFPQVRLIVNPQNVGFARANNQAHALCRGEYLLLLNSDAEVLPGTLDTLVEYLDQHPVVGVAGSRMIHPDGSFQYSCSRFPSLSDLFCAYFLGWHSGRYPREWHERAMPVDTVIGAGLMIRKSIADRLGLMDPDFYMNSDDVDLNYRVRKLGYEVHYVPMARIIHHVGQSMRQHRARMTVELQKSRVLFFRKHRGWGTAAAAGLIILVGYSCSWIIRPCRRLVRICLGPLLRRASTSVLRARQHTAAPAERQVREPGR